MLRTTFIALLFAAIALPFAGCGSEDRPAIRSLTITSNDLFDGTLYVIKDTGVFVGVTAIDETGAAVDEDRLEEVEWTSDDETVVQVHSLGATGVIAGQLDWFDTVPAAPDAGDTGTEGDPPPEPYEPEAEVTATLGDASASVRVRVILNAAGSWRVSLDDGTTVTLELEQNGRVVRHAATGASGSIEGASFSLDFVGYVLNGAFTDRDTVEGDYTKPNGDTGTWSAVRDH